MVLLHGTLNIHIDQATDLPLTISNQAAGIMKRVMCCNAGPTLVGSCDPYVRLDIGKTPRLRSTIIQNNHNPVWDQRAILYVADEADDITVEIKDADRVGAEFLGMAVIPVKDIISGQPFDQWLNLVDKAGQPISCYDRASKKQVQSRLHISIKFTPVGAKTKDGAAVNEVPHTYFPQRDGNKVTLYHDSVCTPGPVDGITLSAGGLYSESSCWDDLYDAINAAKRFIWITGWSIWTETRLRREPDRPDTSPTLGELLIQKADEGVNVLLLVWDDQTNNYGLHSGVMATHDQETLSYFKGTNVTCVLCPRQGSDEDSYLTAFNNRNMFTHHQKTVILDAPMEPGAAAAAAAAAAAGTTAAAAAPASAVPATLDTLGTPTGSPKHGGKHHHHVFSRHKHKEHKGEDGEGAGGAPAERRRVIAFIGGLDLTDGRYDTPSHPLFETIKPDMPNNADFYQGCIEGLNPARAALREPWHDIHAKVEGPVALDICLNFMERWVKQAGKTHLKDMTHLDDHGDLHLPSGFDTFLSKRALLENMAHNRGKLMVRMESIKKTDTSLAVTGLPEPEKWSVQLFRSIDSDSAAGLPTTAEGIYELGLLVGKGKSIDASIHTAYIELIRNAKRYLYLENQYFLGSSHLWDADTETPCFNQVPAEIALKIASKIKAGEEFRVYIVTPLHPEGIPTSGSVQAILHFQHMTRKMMYRLVAEALEEQGITGVQPKDYLHFFCLGKREELTPEAEAAINAASDAAALNATTPANGTTAAPAVVRSLSRGAAAEPTGRGPEHLPPADANTPQQKAVANRRFMVYVHSKLMIVDDEYILLGSANINQRSLDGTRDSEICIGTFQNGYVMGSARDPLPKGQVAGFRKALWREHLDYVGPEVDDPSSLECMQYMQRIGRENWKAFAAKKITPLPRGLLMNYPIFVTEDGAVGALPGAEDFPDLGGRILGTKSAVLPGVLTS